MGKASTKAQNKYIAKTYDRINLTVPKGRKADIEVRAAALGLSVNGYIAALVRTDLGLQENQWKDEK